MKAKLFFPLFTLLPLATFAWQGEVTVETPNTQLLLTAWDGGDLRQSYYGNKSATLQELRDGGCDLSFHALPASALSMSSSCPPCRCSTSMATRTWN